MADSAGEKKRKATLKRAKKVRDMLLNAQANVPGMVREMNEMIEALEPTKEKEKEDGKEDADGR